MDRLRCIATAWVLKSFKDMGGKDLHAEEQRMRQDDKYLSEWLVATQFRKISLPEFLYFWTPDAVVPVGVDVVNISITRWSVENNDDGTSYVEVIDITCDAKDPYTKWYIENYPFDMEVAWQPWADDEISQDFQE